MIAVYRRPGRGWAWAAAGLMLLLTIVGLTDAVAQDKAPRRPKEEKSSAKGAAAKPGKVSYDYEWIRSIQRAVRQKNAIEAIVNAGGTIMYDYEDVDAIELLLQMLEDLQKSTAELTARRWSHDLFHDLSDVYCGKVVYVCLGGPQVTNDTLKCLSALPDVVTLTLYGSSKVTDDGVQHLLKVKNLEVLYVNHTGITEKGVRQLVALPQLRILSPGRHVTDDIIPYLKRMNKLEEVHLGGSHVTAKGVADLLANLPNLIIPGYTGDYLDGR